MKRTYIFGAGASFQAVPVNNGLITKLKNIIKCLQLLQHNTKPRRVNDILNLIQELEWLLQESNNESTFDKTAFLKRTQPDYNRYKQAIGIMITLSQLNLSRVLWEVGVVPPGIEEESKVQNVLRVDNRYSEFLFQLEMDNAFKEGHKIISWNYDSQFELAASKMLNQVDIPIIQEELGMVLPNRKSSWSMTHKNIFRINGSCDFIGTDHFNQSFSALEATFDSSDPVSIFLDTCNRLASFIKASNLSPGVNYSWDRFGEVKDEFLNVISNEVKGTKELIIIGYSFHSFNKIVDQRIFNAFGNELERVVLIDPCDKNKMTRIQNEIKRRSNFVPIGGFEWFENADSFIIS